MPPHVLSLGLGFLLVVSTLAAGIPAAGQTPKRGGVLNAMLAEDPPGLSCAKRPTPPPSGG
jgi:hypothetical protein